MRHGHTGLGLKKGIGDLGRLELREVIRDILGAEPMIGHAQLVEGRRRLILPMAVPVGRQDKSTVLVIELLTGLDLQFHPHAAGLTNPGSIELVSPRNRPEHPVVIGRRGAGMPRLPSVDQRHIGPASAQFQRGCCPGDAGTDDDGFRSGHAISSCGSFARWILYTEYRGAASAQNCANRGRPCPISAFPRAPIRL